MNLPAHVPVGVIGVGNCARALIEGTAYYRDQAHDNIPPAGLMHTMIGPYGPGSIEPVAAWDVDAEKVGKRLWDAITCGQNLPVLTVDRTREQVGDDVIVHRAPTLDGAGEKYLERIQLAVDWPNIDGSEIEQQIRDTGVRVLLNYLPVGSQTATEWWADMALRTGCAFVNNIPVFIARNSGWRARFRDAHLPLIGDDIKSQLGATYLHRALVRAFSDRGILLDRTYQLNVGGNMDFFNMLQRDRLTSKKESKTGAVTDAYRGRLNPSDVHIGPSDYVPWLGDTKVAIIRCEGRGFAGAPIDIDMTIRVPDSPNSAGVVIDAARLAALAMDRQDPAVDEWVSAWLFKAPPSEVAQESDATAMTRLDEWLARHSTTPLA
jgi:myo-inositol-1-phosphate synthase